MLSGISSRSLSLLIRGSFSMKTWSLSAGYSRFFFPSAYCAVLFFLLCGSLIFSSCPKNTRKEKTSISIPYFSKCVFVRRRSGFAKSFRRFFGGAVQAKFSSGTLLIEKKEKEKHMKFYKRHKKKTWKKNKQEKSIVRHRQSAVKREGKERRRGN